MRVKNNDLKESIRIYFEQYCEEKGYAPTVREVSGAMSITVNKAYRYLSDLQTEGAIAKERGFVSKKIANKNEELHIEILNQDKYVSLPKTFLPDGDYAFIEEGGALYLIDTNKTASEGDLVAATLDDKAVFGSLVSGNTVKLFDGLEVSVEAIIGVAFKALRDI